MIQNLHLISTFQILTHHEIYNFNKQKNPSILRHNSQFSRCLLKTVYHEIKNISNLGPKIWDLVPNSIKKIDSLEVFKQAIKEWKLENCP